MDKLFIQTMHLIDGTIVLMTNTNQNNLQWVYYDFEMGNKNFPSSTFPKFFTRKNSIRVQNLINYATNYVFNADSGNVASKYDFIGINHSHVHQLTLWGIYNGQNNKIDSLDFEFNTYAVPHKFSSINDTVKNLIISSSDSLLIFNDSLKNVFFVAVDSSILFLKNMECDTIYFGNVNIIIHAGDTIRAKKYLVYNIYMLTSSVSGSNAYINSDSINCWWSSSGNNFSDLKFIGQSAVIDTVGTIHQNISGNIIYSSGPCNDMVWPGDIDRDMIVTNLDALYIGVANGSIGIQRNNASNSFTPQYCQSWSVLFSNWNDYKNADCDGNGIINANDTLAVSLNYGQTRPFRLAQHHKSGNTGLSIQLPASILPNTTYSVPVLIGDVNNPLNAIYGAAFSIIYDGNQIDANSVSIDFSNSWIKSGNQFLPFQKNLPAENMIDATIVRTNQTDTSGYGIIGMLTFKTKATANGNLIFDFNPNKTEVIDHQSNALAIGWVADTATILTSGVKNINSFYDNSLSVYPNPTNSQTLVISQQSLVNATVRLINLTGQTIFEKQNQSGNQFTIDLSSQVQGIYFIEVKENEKVWRNKIVKEAN
jgi:hypothetical protein